MNWPGKDCPMANFPKAPQDKTIGSVLTLHPHNYSIWEQLSIGRPVTSPGDCVLGPLSWPSKWSEEQSWCVHPRIYLLGGGTF